MEPEAEGVEADWSRGGNSQKRKQRNTKKADTVCEKGSSYRESWRKTAYEEHHVLSVKVKQGVGPWGFALLDELLLIGGALAGNGQEHLPVSAQSGRDKNNVKSPK